VTGRRVVVLAAFLAVACQGEHEEGEQRASGAGDVPGLETAVAAAEAVRDQVRGFGAVAAEGETPEVRDARAALAEAEARHTLAVQQVERLTALASGAVAPRKELEAARAEEASAAAAAARARRVFAGFGSGAGGPPLAPDETWVMAHVVQSDVGRVEAGAEARFAPDAFPGRTFAAPVDGAPAYVDPTTRLAPVRMRVHDREHILRPGMTGAVVIEVGAPHPAVTVPAAAVVYDGPQPMVFVEEGAGRYAPHPVRLGVARDGKIEIAAGVEAGGRVVTTGAASLLSAIRLPAGGEGD